MAYMAIQHPSNEYLSLFATNVADYKFDNYVFTEYIDTFNPGDYYPY